MSVGAPSHIAEKIYNQIPHSRVGDGELAQFYTIRQCQLVLIREISTSQTNMPSSSHSMQHDYLGELIQDMTN